MSGRFGGKVAIVTGGASGIGAATVERLLAEGAGSVIIADRNCAAGEVLAEKLGDRASFAELDVTSENGWQNLVEGVVDRQGQLDVLVNSAGVAGWGTIDDTALDAFNFTLNINLVGVFLGCRAGVAAMRGSGGGAIVNVSSAMGVRADPNQLAYCASKAAVIHLTKAIALHCGKMGYNIRANAVLPGAVDTPLLAAVEPMLGGREQLVSAMAAAHPVGRMGSPTEIAAAIAFLASEDASFITAGAFAVDGGMAEI